MVLGIGAGALAVLLAVFPQISIDGARAALSLCANILIPSLFPFFVCANMLLDSGMASAAGKRLKKVFHPIWGVGAEGSAAIVMGLISGYPTGAAVTAALYSGGCIKKREAQHLLAFTNNAGPLFVIGTLGVGMYKSSSVGYILLISTVTASLLAGVIFRIFSEKEEAGTQKVLMQKTGNCMEKAVETMLSLCGYVVFFASVIVLLEKAGVLAFLCNLLAKCGVSAGTARLLVMGFLELSTAAGAAEGASVEAMAFILSWGGCSVFLQTAGIVRRAGLSMKSYIGGKMIASVLSALFCRILLHVWPQSQSVFAPFSIPQIETAIWIGFFAAALCISCGIWSLFCVMAIKKGRK